MNDSLFICRLLHYFFSDTDFLITVIRNHINSRSFVKQCSRTEAKAVQ